MWLSVTVVFSLWVCWTFSRRWLHEREERAPDDTGRRLAVRDQGRTTASITERKLSLAEATARV
jgi:hypothetical protein